MSFPTTAVTTTNLDAGTDDPALARVDLLDAVTKLNTIITEANGADGVVTLTSSGKLSATVIPNTMVSTGTLNLAPTNGIVNIQDRLRLTPVSVTVANALASPVEGDLVYCTNGDAGDPCVAVYNGTAWKKIALGATISAT